MKITSVPTFVFENGCRVEFFPISNVPGYTHKVYLVDTDRSVIAYSWFSPSGGSPELGRLFRIDKKSAQYFYDTLTAKATTKAAA